MESSFVAWGSRFDGIRRLHLHSMYIMSISCCPCFLGISQLDILTLSVAQRVFETYRFWSNDLPPLSEDFLNGPLLWVLWRTVKTGDVCTTLSGHSNVYGWLRTARNWGLAIVLPRIQLCKQCSATLPHSRLCSLCFIVHPSWNDVRYRHSGLYERRL